MSEELLTILRNFVAAIERRLEIARLSGDGDIDWRAAADTELDQLDRQIVNGGHRS